jgi:hypothetical protein
MLGARIYRMSDTKQIDAMMYDAEMEQRKKEQEMKKEVRYMNPETGYVDSADGWWYKDENDEWVNGVERGEVVAVVQDENNQWVKVK